MNTTGLVLTAGLRDLARNRWIAAYAAGFSVIGEGLFWFGGTGPAHMVSPRHCRRIWLQQRCTWHPSNFSFFIP